MGEGEGVCIESADQRGEQKMYRVWGGGVKGETRLDENDLEFVINVQSQGSNCHISKTARSASHLHMRGTQGCMTSFVDSFLSKKKY